MLAGWRQVSHSSGQDHDKACPHVPVTETMSLTNALPVFQWAVAAWDIFLMGFPTGCVCHTLPVEELMWMEPDAARAHRNKSKVVLPYGVSRTGGKRCTARRA